MGASRSPHSRSARAIEGGPPQRGIDCTGVGVIIIDDNGQLFLAWRGALAKSERGLWEFFGSAVEFGDQLADALRREIREEYGIEIAAGELRDVVNHILPAEGQHWLSPSHLCQIASGTPSICEPGKCSAIAWFVPDDMPAELTEVTRVNLGSYLKHRVTIASA